MRETTALGPSWGERVGLRFLCRRRPHVVINDEMVALGVCHLLRAPHTCAKTTAAYCITADGLCDSVSADKTTDKHGERDCESRRNSADENINVDVQRNVFLHDLYASSDVDSHMSHVHKKVRLVENLDRGDLDSDIPSDYRCN